MKSTIQYILTATILLIFSSSLTFAQDSDLNHSLTEDSKALQFSITENFTLRSFGGNLFSYNWHSSDDRVNRISIGMQNRFLKETDTDTDEELRRSVDVNLNLNYSRIHYSNIENNIKFYFGYGPGVNFIHNYRTSSNANIRSTGGGVSLQGLTGVQWFFHPSISVHSEYGASLRAIFIQEKIENELGTTNSDINLYSLSGDGVRFGLSVYF